MNAPWLKRKLVLMFLSPFWGCTLAAGHCGVVHGKTTWASQIDIWVRWRSKLDHPCPKHTPGSFQHSTHSLQPTGLKELDEMGCSMQHSTSTGSTTVR